MNYARYGTTKQIDDTFKVIIYARENNPVHNTIIQQFEICKNFADFYDYEVVGLATQIETLFKASVEFDAVLVTTHSRISRDVSEYLKIKKKLLERGIIIITAVRS